MARKKMDFEEALKKLTENVRTLEEGTVSLEESLKLFEESIKLSKYCAKYLSEAELKIKKLVETEMGLKFEDFKDD
ncbi:MAG: exodeoxyribonuclease VII small subunit [Thermoplasmata archaeon]|nr:MAG: exodeoxyribonuclease VII small subunit [Thermoplasmata archaeon]